MSLAACQVDSPTDPNPPVTQTPTTISVAPDSLLMTVGGDTARFTAVVRDQNGNEINGLVIAWSSSDTAVAKVGSNGLVTSGQAGSAVISATVESLKAEHRAVVKLQLNARCSVPTAFPTQGAVHGAPSFELETLLAPNPPYDLNDVGVIDLDADGDNDLVVASWKLPSQSDYTGTMLAWRNVDGTLVDATSTVFGDSAPVADHPLVLLTHDFDGDGRQDLYVPQQGLDAAPFPGAPNVLLMQDGAGTLRDASGSQLPASNTAVTHWGAAADVDCDGDIDIYDANIGEAGGGPKLLLNDGSGRFAEADRLPASVAQLEQRYTSADFCDVDRDGDADLVLGGWWRGDDLLLNDGFGNFRFAQAGTMPAPLFGDDGKATTHVYCNDLDRDGWPDIVTNTTDHYTTGRITIYRNRGNGTFEDATSNLPQRLEEWYSRVYVADMNGDGWLDIVASQPFERWGEPGGEVMFINRGDTAFDEVLLPTSVQYARLFPVDVTGDGRTDIVSIDRGKGVVQMLRNSGF